MSSTSLSDRFLDPSRSGSWNDETEVVTADDVRWLLRNLDMHDHLPFMSMKQVTPALIVKLFQKLFTVELHELREGDDVHNVDALLDALAAGGLRLDVSASDIARGDEMQMNQLLQVCLDAHTQQREEQMAHTGAAVSAALPAEDAPASVASTPVDKIDFIQEYVRRHRNAVSGGVTPPPEGSVTSSARGKPRDAAPPGRNSRAQDRVAADAKVRMQEVVAAVGGSKCRHCVKQLLNTRECCATHHGLRGSTADRAMAAAERNRLRDERIEKVRAARFIEAVRDAELSRRVADHSRAVLEHRRQFEAAVKRERAAAATLRKMSRDEDEQRREHLVNRMCSVASARSARLDLRLSRNLPHAVRADVHPIRELCASNQRRFARDAASWRTQDPFELIPAVAKPSRASSQRK
uniref:Uncharacterized protein n=1 Tax=Neobodo designis TaxID=312471 RepID=A0A7S1Q9R5_NEODS|mmetsp:Transcript_3603/g.11273  ORF Transcript_3603/g.11273 Transcript_3603/m.11273 type:complete len:409 (+) Transcript_3603:32-1258(+)